MPSDEPKDRRFRKKLIPITDAVRQQKPKILSIEMSKPKTSDGKYIHIQNRNEFEKKRL